MAILFFVREEGFSGISDFVVIKCLCDSEWDTDEILGAMNRAFNTWMENTEAGHSAWVDSSEDFNIGDYLQVSDDEDLKTFLAEEGLELEILSGDDHSSLVPYDQVLASPSIGEEEEEELD